MKKKDKKAFKRINVRIKNISITDMDVFEDEDSPIKDKTTTKILDKYKSTKKTGIKLKSGKVLKVTANYQAEVLCDGKILNAVLSGRLKQIAFDTKNILTVGDNVKIDDSVQPRIEEISERTNMISRYSEGKIQKKIPIASNINQLIIVSSCCRPEISFGLIDRYICAAELENIVPIICINKMDLYEKDENFERNVSYYKKNGYTVVLVSAYNGTGLDELKKILKDKTSVFSGHSGVGKTSIINKLQPGLNLRIANVNNHTSKGTHTTTTARMIEWNFGGFIVDTPGIKTFMLNYEDADKIPRVFPGFKSLFTKCKYSDCTHIHEKECAIKTAVKNGKILHSRYESYLRIYDSLKEK